MSEKKTEITQAREMLQKRVKGSGELEISCWRTCADVPVLHFKEGGRAEDEIMVEQMILL